MFNRANRLADEGSLADAQDHAFAMLASKRGFLTPERLDRVAALRRELGNEPLAQILLKGGVLEPRLVTGLLRDLTRSQFFCELCSLAFSYDNLASLPDLICQCGRTLTLRVDGSDVLSHSDSGGAPSSAGGSVDGSDPAGRRRSHASSHGRESAHRGRRASSHGGQSHHRAPGGRPTTAPGYAQPSGAHPAVNSPSGAYARQTGSHPAVPSGAYPAVPSGSHPAVPSGSHPAAHRPTGAHPAIRRPTGSHPAVPPSSGGRPALPPTSQLGASPPAALWDGEATVLDRGRNKKRSSERRAPVDQESLVKPAKAWDGEATVLDKHRKKRRPPPGFDDEETERGAPAPRLMPPPPAIKAVRPKPATQEVYDPEEETVRDKRVLEIPPSGLPEAQPAPPEKIGPYTLISELGRGGNGVIYLARHQGLERRFAVKILMGGELLDDETIVRFQQEAAVASKIDDPGIIGVYDVGKEGDRYYYAMEYVPGRTLEDRLRRGPLKAREAAKIVQRLALSIHAAHAHGVIHRDIKPGNIIMEEGSGRPRITDFGVARDMSQQHSMTRTGELLGTPYYMAPEQLLGEKDIDHRVDVYALGVVLYECLTTKRPFEARTAVLLAEKVCTTSPAPLRQLEPSIPDQLESICMQAISRDRNRRQRSAKTLAADLGRFLDQAAGPPAKQNATRGPLAEVLGSLQAWHWVALTLAACALAAALAFLALTEINRTGSAPGTQQEGGPRQAGEQPLSGLEDVRLALDDPASDLKAIERDVRRLRAEEKDPQILEELAALEVTLGVTGKLRQAKSLARERAPFDKVSGLLAEARRTARGDPDLNARVGLAEAELCLRRGRLRESGRLADSLANGPYASPARLIQAWCHVLDEDPDRAQGELGALLRDDPQGDTAERAKAWQTLLDGNGLRASGALRRLLQAAPDDVELLLLHGLAQVALREHRGGLRAFERAATFAPDDLRAHLLLSRIQLSSDPKAALASADAAVRLSQPEPLPAALFQRALAHVQSGDYVAGRRDIDRVLAARPNHVPALVLGGSAAHRAGDDETAIGYWERAAKTDGRAFAAALRGLPSREQATVEQALAIARMAREEHQGERAPQPRAGLELPSVEQADPALDPLLEQRAEAAGPAARGPLFEALRASARGSSRAEVAAACDRLAKAAPESPAAAREQALLLLGRYAYDDAEAALARASELGSISGRELEWLEAVLARRRGVNSAAIPALERLAKGDDRFAKLAQGELALYQLDPKGAVRLGRELLEAQPAEPFASAIAIEGEVTLGRLEQAAELLRRVWQTHGALDGRLLVLRTRLAVEDILTRRVSMNDLIKIGDVFDALRKTIDAAPTHLLGARYAFFIGRQLPMALRWGSERLSMARQAEPERPEVHFWLGLFALTQASQDECLRLWEMARSYDPQAPLPPQFRQLYVELGGDQAQLSGLFGEQ